jgi:hydrogenase maturation protease
MEGDIKIKQLILGIGNLLLGDEGVGVHAAQVLLTETLPGDTEVLEVGTAILDAMEALEAADRVIVMDAVKAGELPGSIYRIPLEECKAAGNIGSMHGFDIGRVMALSRRKDLPEVVVIGIEPAVIDWTTELSPEVSGMFAHYLDTVRQEINSEYSSVKT